MNTNIEKHILKDVSCETLQILRKYQSMLNDWQQKFNLVSNASLADAWVRHILDSAQLYQHLNFSKDKLVVCDFGSGAGFPALVLAIIAKEKNPNYKFILIESIKKKASFLNTVIKEFNLNAEVLNDRIESVKLNNVDVITARAVCSLTKLFGYTSSFLKNKTVCLFLKGKTYKEEIKEAYQRWNFDVETVQSMTSVEGVVLKIKNIRSIK